MAETGDRSAFRQNTTTDEVLAGIDLEGRVALVTGASGGLGEETARALASKGASVTLAVRDPAKGAAAADRIRKSVPDAKLDVGELDLSEPSSVRAFAGTWLAGHSQLHTLVNNAGVMGCPLTRTGDGWEMQLATNHVGHFLLTALLSPALRAAAPGRVVTVSSAGHRFSSFDWDDPHFESRPYDRWTAYGQSKTANVLFSVELDRRLAAANVRAFAVHPGGIVTELGRHLSPEDIQELLGRAPGGRGIEWKTVAAGAATSVWAATAPELDGRGGLYLEDCRPAAPMRDEADAGGFEDFAVDPEAARRLWAWTEDLLGERFDLGA